VDPRVRPPSPRLRHRRRARMPARVRRRFPFAPGRARVPQHLRRRRPRPLLQDLLPVRRLRGGSHDGRLRPEDRLRPLGVLRARLLRPRRDAFRRLRQRPRDALRQPRADHRHLLRPEQLPAGPHRLARGRYQVPHPRRRGLGLHGVRHRPRVRLGQLHQLRRHRLPPSRTGPFHGLPHRPAPGSGRTRLQDRRLPLPGLGAGRLPGLAGPRDPTLVWPTSTPSP